MVDSPHIRMRRRLSLPIAPAPLPEGVVVVPFGRATARAGREVMRRAYDGDLGDRGISFDGYWQWLTTDAEFDPALVFIAAADGEVVGLCHCWTSDFVKDLVVDEPFRRRGLGAALLTLALQEFERRGSSSVDLKTGVDNVRAQSLYRRLGFEVVELIGA
jgi:ribosomal protein S18 acetylase RimI-like enzyme